MTIEKLISFSGSDLEDLSVLMRQLSADLVLTEERLSAVLADESASMFVMREDGRVIGCITLCVYEAPSGRKAWLEDFVVLDECRGRHLGRQLFEYALAEAHKLAPADLYFTSKPERVAANALYRSLGFVRRETNCYKMKL